MKHVPVPPARRLPLRQIEEAKNALPSTSAARPARSKLRHAAITDALGSYGNYANWAKGMRARWKSG